VLSTSGHIVALVNPPDNPKAKWQTAERNPPDPDRWLEEATTNEGSWWMDWTDWLGERSGESRPAPQEPGGGQLPILGAAPGSYVMQRL
jgi:polyhydroxyalkanoate synthase